MIENKQKNATVEGETDDGTAARKEHVTRNRAHANILFAKNRTAEIYKSLSRIPLSSKLLPSK